MFITYGPFAALPLVVSVVGDGGLLHPLHDLHVGCDVLPVSGRPLETTHGTVIKSGDTVAMTFIIMWPILCNADTGT